MYLATRIYGYWILYAPIWFCVDTEIFAKELATNIVNCNKTYITVPTFSPGPKMSSRRKGILQSVLRTWYLLATVSACAPGDPKSNIIFVFWCGLKYPIANMLLSITGCFDAKSPTSDLYLKLTGTILYCHNVNYYPEDCLWPLTIHIGFMLNL
jgi:hypothetical protein